MLSIKNIFLLYCSHFKSQKKHILLSSIGFIIFTGLLASTLLSVYSLSGTIVEQAKISNNGNYFQAAQSDFSYSIELNASIANKNQMIDYINHQGNKIIEDLSLTKKLNFTHHFNYLRNIDLYLDINGSQKIQHALVIELNENIRNELKLSSLPTLENSNFPQNSSEGYLIHYLEGKYSNDYSSGYESVDMQIGDTINYRECVIYYPTSDTCYYLERSYTNPSGPIITSVPKPKITSISENNSISLNRKNYTLKLTGLSTLTFEQISNGQIDLKYKGIKDSFLNFLYASDLDPIRGMDILLVNNITSFIQNMDVISNPNSVVKLGTRGFIDINYSFLNGINIGNEYTNIIKFYSRFRDKLNLYNDISISKVDFLSQQYLQQSNENIEGIINSLLAFTTPIFLVTLLFSYYSINLLFKTSATQILKYRMRGTPNSLMILFFFIDYLVINIISVILGLFFVGIPLANLILRSNGFFQFNLANAKPLHINGQFSFETILIANIFISALLYIPKILSFLGKSISEIESPKESAKSTWESHHLDFMFIILGFIGFLIYYLLFYPKLEYYSGLFVVIFMLFPILFIIGILLNLSRIYTKFFSSLSNKLWQTKYSLYAFSLKYLVKSRQQTKRMILVISILIIFMVSFYTFPVSINRYHYEVNLEKIGADASTRYDPKLLRQWIASPLQNGSINNEIKVTPYIETFLKESPSDQIFNKIYVNSQYFLGINISSYLEIAKFAKDPNSKNPLSSVVKSLKNKTDTLPGTIIDKTSFERRGLSIGDQITIKTVFGTAKFIIKDTFDFWPNFNEPDTYGCSCVSEYVVDLNWVLNNLLNSSSNLLTTKELGFLFSYKNDSNYIKDNQLLKENFGINVESLIVNYDKDINNINNLVQIGQINVNIIVSTVLISFMLIMYVFMILNERKRNFYTATVFGMNQREQFRLLFNELLTIQFTGAILGIILGLISTTMLSLFIIAFIGHENTSIQISLYFPLDLILGTVILISLITLIVIFLFIIIFKRNKMFQIIIQE